MISKSVDETEKTNFDLMYCGPTTCWFPRKMGKHTKNRICQYFQLSYVQNQYFGHTRRRRCLLDSSSGGFLVYIGTIKNINLFVHSSPGRFFFWRFSILEAHRPGIIVLISTYSLLMSKIRSQKSFFGHILQRKRPFNFSLGGFLIHMCTIKL